MLVVFDRRRLLVIFIAMSAHLDEDGNAGTDVDVDNGDHGSMDDDSPDTNAIRAWIRNCFSCLVVRSPFFVVLVCRKDVCSYR